MKFINEWADIASNIMSVAGGASAALGTWLGGKYGGNAVSNSLDSIIAFTKNVQKSAQGTSAISNANALEVEEASLLELCAKFKGYKYTSGKKGHPPVRYPYEVEGTDVKVAKGPDKKYINCCTFIEALLVRCWLDTNKDKGFDWTLLDHGEMMIFEEEKYPNSSIDIVVKKRMAAKSITVQSPDSNATIQMPHMQIQPWSIVQVWRWNENESGKFTTRKLSGHTFLVWKVEGERDDNKILTLESNYTHSLSKNRSVGYRGVGEIEVSNDLVIEPKDWQVKVWTWEKFKQTYPEITVAKLNVTI